MTTTITPSAPALITHHPALDESRARLSLPVAKVTLLEDRAQVRREGPVTLTAGHNRLAVWGIAPVVQDVSLRVEIVGAAKMLDARVRRALRVGHKEKPEAAAELERRIAELTRQHGETTEDQNRAIERASVVTDMMHKAMAEVPEDAAWSLGHPQTWRETFEALSGKARALQKDARGHAEKMEDLAEQIRHLVMQRSLLDRPDTAFECVAEIDVDATSAGSVTIALEYTVPNALWRPFHTAELKGNKLKFSSQAAVWQNTGEDWTNAELVFSTARSSLGHEPPKLNDDKLAAKKKDNKVVVEAREQAISNVGLGRGPAGGGGSGAPRPASGVSLPGVDDGGDIQNLRAAGRITVPSDGRPAFVPVFDFESDAETSLVCMPELDEKAFFRSTQSHGGRHPILAGPVELVRASGFVGTTSTLFVAPGERFQLGFGPDHDVRVQRAVETEEEVDEVDKWRRRTVQVSIFLSNLSGDEKQLEICERIPVSEIEHVKITLVADKTSGAPVINEHGVLTWKMPLAALGRLRLMLVYVVATAPGVQGL